MQMGMNKDAVQNERQPRNTATLRPENLAALDSERILREAVGAFGYEFQINYSTRAIITCSSLQTALEY